MKPSIAIITRMAFSESLTFGQCELFQTYMQFLNSQTYRDFTVYILADEVRAFKGSKDNKAMIEIMTSNMDFIKVEDPERFNFDIEIRLDFDDIVAPTFVQDVVDQYNATNKDTFVISYQPIMVDERNGDEYRHPSQYSEDCSSMCMALCQKGEKTKGVYDRPHNLMAGVVGHCVVRPEGFYYLVVHGENALSTLPGKEYKL